MRFTILPVAVSCACVTLSLPAAAQFATLPQADAPMQFSPDQCNALHELQNGVASRSASEIQKIGDAMEANQNADPATVAQISGLSVPTVSTIGSLSQQDGMIFSLAFGSMLRHYHPELLSKVLRERGARGQIPNISDNPLGMTVLNGMMDTAQQSYLTQCS